MKVSKFYNTEFVDYSSYDNLRKISSVMDGLKNASRKVMRTIIDKKITTDIKVSQLNSKMAEYCEYLHGDASGVIVTMAQNFVGKNNMNLLEPSGNFGTRFINDASAPRYIYTFGTEHLWNNFKQDDKNILIPQFFEGVEIEPQFYLPALPMLLINGSNGVSSGFSQTILGRNPDEIKKYLVYNLEGKNKSNKPFKNKPYFEGFTGTIEQGETDRQWVISGRFSRKNSNTVEITELPTNYDLKSYLKILDTLEDSNIIKSYKDKSDAKNDKFHFEVKFSLSDLKDLSDEQILQKLKLVSRESEIYTALDETNTIKVFDSINDIFWYYYDVKIQFLQKRKDYLVLKYEEDIRLDISKYTFIKMIVENELIISKRKKDDIIRELEGIKNIIPRDESYDYLLGMPIGSLTKERMDKLMQDIKDKKSLLDETKIITLENMWLKDLGEIK